ncbi:MAG: heme ABC exporter ATP-binding protein CcmA [Hyphomicrobiales bacterium]|nr:heme ABC exporter ATP-binding protein CcmA [Hyphomicrobiales bacterium]
MRLVAEKVGGERGGETVFSGIDFAVSDGETLIVTGPNGSGKSTLLRIIAGLLPAAEGSIQLEGGGEQAPDPAAACHYLGHENGMKPVLSVAENLDFWQNFNGAPALGIGEALEAVGLETVAHLPYGYLSTGQRRRIAIARLLISRRPLWLLDEPTAGLDRRSEERFAALMTGHLREGGMIVAATHVALGLEGVKELRMGGATHV